MRSARDSAASRVRRTGSTVSLHALVSLFQALTPVLRVALGRALITLSKDPIGIELDDDPGVISTYSLRIIRSNFVDKDGDGIPDTDRACGSNVIRSLAIKLSPRDINSSPQKSGRLRADSPPIRGGIDLDGDGVPDIPAPDVALQDMAFHTDLKFPAEWEGSEADVVKLFLCLDVALEAGSEHFWLRVQGNRCWAPTLGQIRLERLRFIGNVACWWNVKAQKIKLCFLPSEPPVVYWDTELETCGCQCPDAIEDRLATNMIQLVLRKLFTYPQMIDLDLNPFGLPFSLHEQALAIVGAHKGATAAMGNTVHATSKRMSRCCAAPPE